ncbi:MAG: ATP-binding protein [Gammaproteobacteria bacterium]|nr:ATP-binding protein [Gammaproteobacteria bacterium]
MNRPYFTQQIEDKLRTHPIVGILGPRQCGKTTLAKIYAEKMHLANVHHFDLEDPIDLARLENPKLTLEPLKGLIIIDEIKHAPNLFKLLRVLVDKNPLEQKYLILGSASRELIKQSAESLAGRISYLELTPFSYSETHDLGKLWLCGGFPKSYLATNEKDSYEWRENYITTYLEQDLPNLGIHIAPQSLRRFWEMLAHYHANILNASELGRSFGSADTTIRRYLDILSGTFMVRQLQPWHANINKRQVKSPKIYFRDSGLFHTLLRIKSWRELQRNIKLGASWEGFALEEIIRTQHVKSHDCYFWQTHAGAELDLLLLLGDKKIGFEFKYTDAPKTTKSMHVSLEDLELDHLNVIYPGTIDYKLSEKISVFGLKNWIELHESE